MDELRRVLVVCVAVMAGACGGSGGGDVVSGDPSAFQADMQGTWVRCDATGGGSSKTTRVISGLNITVTNEAFSSSDCTGTPVFADVVSFTIHIGGTTRTTVGTTTVTATQIELSDAVGTFYDLGFVDTEATPDRIYFGDTTGALDGSSPALRPTSLLESEYATKQ